MKEAERTPEQVHEAMRRSGVTVAEWARSKGYSAALVYRILGGHVPQRGQSYSIAVELGLAPGGRQGMDGFDAWLAEGRRM